jgi:hypothetical protein
MKYLSSLLLLIAMSSHALASSCDDAITAAALEAAKAENPGIVSMIELDPSTTENPKYLGAVVEADLWKVRVAIRDCFAEYTVKTTNSCGVESVAQSFYGQCS